MTKNRLLPLVFFAILGVLASCKNSGTPKSIAEKFLISFSQMDYKTAKSFSTKDTWNLLNTMSYYTDSLSANQKKALTSGFKITIKGIVNETDSTTLVSYQITQNGKVKKLPFNQLKLVKQVDLYGHVRWKVSISTLALIEKENFFSNSEGLPENTISPLNDSTVQ